jgi:nucleoside-diphosphate-sugar epimerase
MAAAKITGGDLSQDRAGERRRRSFGATDCKRVRIATSMTALKNLPADAGDYHEPLNLSGSDISINELVDIVAKISGKRIGKRYDTTKPQGVRGRCSDNALARNPEMGAASSLEEGLRELSLDRR